MHQVNEYPLCVGTSIIRNSNNCVQVQDPLQLINQEMHQRKLLQEALASGHNLSGMADLQPSRSPGKAAWEPAPQDQQWLSDISEVCNPCRGGRLAAYIGARVNEGLQRLSLLSLLNIFARLLHHPCTTNCLINVF